FNANAGWLYGLEDIRGYDSVILRQYTDYMGAIEPQNELLFNRIQGLADWNAINSPLVDLLGVKYIITQETLDLPKLALAWEGEGVRIYENLAVMPRAYTIARTATAPVADFQEAVAQYDPRQYVLVEATAGTATATDVQSGQPQPAEVLARGNIELIALAEIVEPSWLILNDTYAPGWRAFVRPVDTAGEPLADEQELPITLVNGNFRGVQLNDSGRYEVRFRYSPTSFLVGGLTSLMGAVILLLGMIVWLWRRFFDPNAQLSGARSVAKNSLAPMMLNLFNRGIDFAFALFYLRVLGPAEAGGYATAIVIAGIYDIIANFGLNTYLIREVSRDKSRAGHFLLNTNLLRIGTGLLAAAPVLLYLWVRDGSLNLLADDISLAVLLLMVGMIFSGMGQLLAGLFYAYEQAERPAVVTTITTIMKVGLGVVALLLGQGFVGLATVSILVNLVTLLILILLAWRHFALKGPWRIDWPLQRRMLRDSYPLMINHLLATAFFQIDIVMMEQINGETITGWYSSAYKWVNAFNVIPSFFTFALFPIISRQVQESVAEARQTFQLSLKLMILISLPLAAATMLAAPFLIGVLGGPEFLPAGAISLQIVIWSIPFGWLNSVTNYVLIALGLERIETRAFIAGVLFNIIGNAIFLARYSYVAAAVTTILSEIVLLAIFNYYLRRKMPAVGWVRLLYRPVLAASSATAVMLLGAQLHWLLGIALGLPIYAAGLWLLGVFNATEQSILAQVLPHRLAVRLGMSG
ncbi:MAG: flippase, partial [Anaerolineales bacterium]|nr:flippase [Anaerolineales bacterium]